MPELAAKVDPSQPYQSFEVSEYSNYFMLKFSDRSPFAQVSELVSRGLEMLQQYPCVEMRAFAETKRIQDVLSRAKKPGEASMKVEINIYGSVADADAIGNKLCSANMYLQDPDHGTQDIEYCNPHVVEFPGFEEPKPLTRGQAFLAESWGPSKMVREERENFKHTVSSIYQSLTRSRNLKRMKGGAYILTPLLPHQETALSFMIQKEFGPVLPEFSLWEYECNVITPLYRHKLTNAESTEPPSELGGGILADDMGMGKTLSTLALITTTLEEAREWFRDSSNISRKTRSKATLIIVPSTLIMNSWLKEIEARLDKSVEVLKYYGKRRDLDIEEYLDRDIVLTTYHTIAASANRSNNIIFHIEWFRVVLDEAHMIRRRETTLFQAAGQLSARFRWCLTGTPIQNRLEDIGSLLAFLRLSQFENKSVFQNQIVVPFAEDISSTSKKFALLLDCVCLRRSQELLHLPDITESYHYVTLSDQERKQYDETLALMAKLIREKASRKADHRDPFGIFQAQLQLRLLCNHGTFQKPFKGRSQRDRKAEREDFLYSLGTNAESICAMCGIPIPVFDLSGGLGSSGHICQHKLCQECMTQNRDDSILDGVSTEYCPLCDMSIGQIHGTESQELSNKPEGNNEEYFSKSGFSSKMNALIPLTAIQNRSAQSLIIFSCWTRTLDLVSVYLGRSGISYQRIDGDQVLSQRQYNMDRFVTDERIPILLMSTGVGAFGLNLTAANHVYILEPQWNPSVEAQAIGRVSRLGQNKAVSVTRYLVRGTVEVRMHSQQIRKVELSKIGLKSPTSLAA
ncbi:SNF2 family N-terminal domain-containing protein [Leptodontidium sp. MPI-SDFR-AT-0119]|nr:SNF2 family N-terminal domain-containing protein [Leptodontidium sp. MPI-SDFR-AT-0119]